jgi:hypothetical protein
MVKELVIPEISLCFFLMALALSWTFPLLSLFLALLQSPSFEVDLFLTITSSLFLLLP